MRWIVRLVGIVVSLMILAVAGLFLLPAERIAAIATRQFEAQTGRALSVAGSVRPTIWPILGARIEDVTLASPDWAQGGPLVTAQVLDVGIEPMAMLSGNLVVRRFEARGARVVLERDAQGRANWTFETAGGDGGGSAGGGTLSLERVEIRDAAVRFIDRAAGTDIALEGIDADLSMPSFAGPGTLAISGRQGGQTVSADLRLASVEQFLSGAVTGLAVSARVGEARLGFDGRAGLDPLAAEGRLTLQTPALAPLLALAGQSGPEPLPAAARPLDFAGQVTLAPAGTLHLREAALSAGATRLGLALDLATGGERPRLTGQVSAGALDLRPFLGAGGSGSSGGGGWPTARIDAAALGALDAAITVTAAPVQTGIVDLERFAGVLTIDRARAVLELREARAFGGNLTGELVANNRSGLSVGGTLRGAGIGLLPLLREMAAFERLSGSAGFELRFLGVGQSVDAIMRSLSGQGRIDLGQGEIIGLDLAGMLRNMDMSYMGEANRTVYDAISGTFAMEAGVLSNQDLRLTSSRVNVEGRGRVDLGGQTLEYRVIPSALRNAETGEAIRVPLVITGPWSAPRFRLDLEGLAEERLREERERLEARAREEAARLEAEARARLDREIQERLGVQRQEGQSTEDAVREGLRERAEQEIGRGLMRLLGGSD